MAFFPQFSAGEFVPLFRLLDDYDSHRSSRSVKRTPRPSRSFVPKFDVRELKDAYHLDGELPGGNQQNIDIEFTEPQELVIKGRIDREYNNASQRDAQETEETDDTSSNKSYQPTVEDEDEEGSKIAPTTTLSTETPPKRVRKTKSAPKYKYWASERAVGEFRRTFAFPTRVDHDAVRASFKDGILSVVVPKASAPKIRKITVE